MSTRDERERRKTSRKKKTSTKENCLLHCREDCNFDDIVIFSETSLTVSLQLVLKACVKRNFYLIRHLLKESHNSQLQYFITFRLQRKLPKSVKTMCFRQKQYQLEVMDIIENVINRIQILKLL